jgi:hypothetical protein
LSLPHCWSCQATALGCLSVLLGDGVLFELGQDLVRVFASQDAFLSAQGQLEHFSLERVDGRISKCVGLALFSLLAHELAQTYSTVPGS